MSIGPALIICVVLVLAVYHEKFRKIVLWSLAVAAVVFVLGCLSIYLYDRHEAYKTKKDISTNAASKLEPDWFQRNAPTMWVAVDPLQQYGGTFVRQLPSDFVKKSCEPGSRVWHEKVEWICVSDMERPEWIGDDSIVRPIRKEGSK
jgi:hypothetical protein